MCLTENVWAARTQRQSHFILYQLKGALLPQPYTDVANSQWPKRGTDAEGAQDVSSK